MIWQLAFRNIRRGGIRTVLNVGVLALVFIAIVFMQGFNQGILEQVSQAKITFEIGGGQYWHPGYDPFDPIGLIDAHGPLPEALATAVREGRATPELIIPGSVYPQGRVMAVQIRGINPDQKILDLPLEALREGNGDIPILIGSRMASAANLREGDPLTLRWRDIHGTYDARDARVATVMNTPVQEIDASQIWMSLDRLYDLTGMDGHATMVVMAGGEGSQAPEIGGWPHKSTTFLLKDLTAMIRFRSIASGIIYLILLALALIAIFDTQILSIFRRRREIGTLVALGMTSRSVVNLFTLEGGLHGILAMLAGLALGTPLLGWVASKGIPLPQATDSYGLALGNVLYPVYSATLVVGTALVVLLAVLAVSYWPARRIAGLLPTDALRGRGI